jgi:hypothetical protein
MIDITTLTEADKGREVRYTAWGEIQYGHITSWNDGFIFVRYHHHINIESQVQTARHGTTSEATRPEDLEFT